MLYRGHSSDQPIVQSFLDTDFYKFTMGDFIFSNPRYADAIVTFRLKCRTPGIKLGKVIPIGHLREELDHVCKLSPTNSEWFYLRGMNVYSDNMFSKEYMNFFRTIRLPGYNLEITPEGDIDLEFTGPWKLVTYWELFGLSIVDELYHRYLVRKYLDLEAERNRYFMTGLSRLLAKIEKIREYPDLTLIDFGTRRRASRDWQNEVVGIMSEQLPNQFKGTSNVKLAMDHNLEPKGTSGHELEMTAVGIADIESGGDPYLMRLAHGVVFEKWWEKYGEGLSIALPDTFGTSFTFSSARQSLARDWKGTRQDSGDPLRYKEKALQWYRGYSVDPRTKMIVFSDGLNVDSMIRIHCDCRGEIIDTYGLGTNLTNDFEPMPEIRLIPLSLVIKPSRVRVGDRSVGLVKLSDNIAKAMGTPEDIAKYRKIFNYNENFFEPCTY